MADHLQVDPGGLTSAAADSHGVVASLTSHESVRTGSGQPSDAGVSAVNAAVSSVRALQAGRVEQQANDMSTAANRYEHTDGRTAGTVAESM